MFGAEAGAEISRTHAGVQANVHLIKAEVSVFDLQLGAGVDTGAGIKDDSLDVHVAGVGF